MAADQHYIAKENFKYNNKDGCTIDIKVGNQFILIEDLTNEKLLLKCVDNNVLGETEVILPRSILENMSKPSTHEPSYLLRSQSLVKERVCSLNFVDKEIMPEKCRNSTFGYGSLQDKMSRSTHEPRRTGTLPSINTAKESHQKEITTDVASHSEKDNVTLMRKGTESFKWNRVEENGRAVHINMDTGDRWHSATDNSGQQYFYNESSRLSTWKLPDDDRSPERFQTDDFVRPLEEVLENLDESSDSEVSWQEDSSDSAAVDKVATLKPLSPTSPGTDAPADNESQDGGSRFSIRQIKKEHISGPLFNKLIRTERSGNVDKTKISENGKEVSKKWLNFHMVLTGPELLFYKDVKLVLAKAGLPQGKVDLKLKIQNLQFSEKIDVGGVGKIYNIQIEDTGAPGSNITYLLRFGSLEEMRAWTAALQFAKDWQNEDRYSESAFCGDSGPPDDVPGDIQNIGMKLKHLLKKRPTRESLEARGILKLESVFGSSLDILCEQEKTKVPEFVFRCILAIEARGLHHNGIYRISGNQAKIQKLRLAVDENKYQLNSESMELETLTGAFKSFFKELKEPLFDEDFCSKMVELLSHRKADKKNPYRDVSISSVRKLLSKLRATHFETARALLGHLHKVAAHASKNLMDVSNLSMVWGPNLYLVAGQASTKLAIVLMTHNQIVDFLIANYADVFDKA